MTLTLKARVRDGRLLLDEPIDLPDGTEIELAPVDDGDTLDEAERERLHEALRAASEELARGEGRAASEVLSRLKARSGA